MTRQEMYQEAMAKAFDNFFEMYINPEVERRQQEGQLPKPTDLRAAQILFFPDRRPTQVRINSEVKALAERTFKPGVAQRTPGDAVFAHEIESLRVVGLAADDDPNCGHATFIRIGQRWSWAFDLRYNKGHARKHLAAASEFYQCAEFALNGSNWIAFVENLFSCAELLAKAMVMCLYDLRIMETASHKRIHSQFNLFARPELGNVAEDQRRTFNRLCKLRYATRYLEKDPAIAEEEARQMLDTVSDMMEEIRRVSAPALTRDAGSSSENVSDRE